MSELYKYWSFVVYPDSAPKDWKDRLASTQVPCAVSPIHSADDEVKKAHYHVLLGFYRACGDKRAREVCNIVGGANGFVECVYAPLGAYEYLTHKNNPEKEQFADGANPELFNGFVVPKIKLDDDAMYEEVQELIFEYNIDEFSDLCKYYRNNGHTEKSTWCIRHAYQLKSLCDSVRYKIDREERAREKAESKDRMELVDRGFVVEVPFGTKESGRCAR